MKYFYEEESTTEETDAKLKDARLTNLGAETKFAKLDNRLKVSGSGQELQKMLKRQGSLTKIC